MGIHGMSISRTASIFACVLSSVFATIGYSKVTESFSQTYPLSASGSISLRNANGAIEVSVWDRQEVAVEAIKTASDASQLERVQIDVTHKPDALSINTRYQQQGWWKFWSSGNASVRYRLQVPKNVAVARLVSVNSSISVTDLTSRLELETVNGRITTTGSANVVEAKTVNGSARLNFSSLPASGEIEVSTVNGSCEINLPGDASYRTEAKAVNGKVRLAEAKMATPANVEYSGPTLRLRSVNGNITVASH